jgi:hypothetical protein
MRGLHDCLPAHQFAADDVRSIARSERPNDCCLAHTYKLSFQEAIPGIAVEKHSTRCEYAQTCWQAELMYLLVQLVLHTSAFAEFPDC